MILLRQLLHFPEVDLDRGVEFGPQERAVLALVRIEPVGWQMWYLLAVISNTRNISELIKRDRTRTYRDEYCFKHRNARSHTYNTSHHGHSTEQP